MRLAPPSSRFFPTLPALALLAAAAAPEAAAALEYRAKTEGAALYRTEALEPPPLASLAEGEGLTLLDRGPDRSRVRTGAGLEGWVRNRDLVGVKLAAGTRHDLGNVDVQADRLNISPIVFEAGRIRVQVQDLERSFADEVVEPLDREQVEMRHDEH